MLPLYISLVWIALLEINPSSLFVLPQFLNSKDVELLSVDVGEEAVRLANRLTFSGAPAVSHQIHTVTCIKLHRIKNRRLATFRLIKETGEGHM